VSYFHIHAHPVNVAFSASCDVTRHALTNAQVVAERKALEAEIAALKAEGYTV